MLRWIFRLFEPWTTQGKLSRLARSTDATTRQDAANQLAQVREMWASQALLQLLADTHTPVRESARQALANHGASATPVLIEGLKHSNENIAVTSAGLLGELRQIESIKPLIVILKYATRPAQLAARRALEQCGEVARPELTQSMTETHPWVRKQITEILEAIDQK